MVNLAAVDLAENGAPRQVHAPFSIHTPAAPSPRGEQRIERSVRDALIEEQQVRATLLLFVHLGSVGDTERVR
jgi:hypothetical protein